MKLKKTPTSVVFSLLVLGGLHAQESPIASGGEASGAGGTTSYSVGQLVYTTDIGTNGSIAKGVQQPFEISVVTSINEMAINLGLNVYPNPTTNYITLKVDDFGLATLKFQLIDLQGRVIDSKRISETNTEITMENLPNATYFLKVYDKKRAIKTFKIIKS